MTSKNCIGLSDRAKNEFFELVKTLGTAPKSLVKRARIGKYLGLHNFDLLVAKPKVKVIAFPKDEPKEPKEPKVKSDLVIRDLNGEIIEKPTLPVKTTKVKKRAVLLPQFTDARPKVGDIITTRRLGTERRLRFVGSR